MTRDIDRITDQLRQRYSDIRHERLRVVHAGADDDGVWFFRGPESTIEVQLESPSGNCPFLVEGDDSDVRQLAVTVDEAVALIVRRLSLGSRTL